MGTIIVGGLQEQSGWGHLTLCFVTSASGIHRLFKEPLLSVPGIKELEINKAWILSSRDL